MKNTKIEGIILTPLKIFTGDDGEVLHGMKRTDASFKGFGEVYFSTVNYGRIKAWKRHRKMTLNLVVPVGKVLFAFLDKREGSTTFGEKFRVTLSQNPYLRLTVPPGLWFGFKGLAQGLNMIINIADIPHDPEEVDRKNIKEIKFDWDYL